MNIAKKINALEDLVGLAKNGEISNGTLIAKFLESTLFIPSATEVLNDGSGLQPLFFPKPGTQMLACFSEKEYAKSFGQIAPFGLTMTGGSLLTRIPKGYGVVLNPGLQVGFEISPQGVTDILNDFILKK